MAKPPDSPVPPSVPPPAPTVPPGPEMVNIDVPDRLPVMARIPESADPTSTTKMDMDAADMMAADMASVHDQVIKYGDLGVFDGCPDMTRQDLQNADFMTIHPGEIYHQDHPDKPYKCYWHLLLKNNLQSMRDLFYLKRRGFVIANKNDGFRSPTLQTSEDGSFNFGGLLVLMVMDEDAYRREKEERNIPGKRILEGARLGVHQYAEQFSQRGIGTVEGESDGDIETGDLRTVVRAGNR